MKAKLFGLAVSVLFIGVLLVSRPNAAEPQSAKLHDYVTIRWGGRENTHIIRGDGKVEFIGLELRKVVRPDRVDERSFYMNLALNGLAKEGYELAALTPDEIVMKRPAR